MKNKPNRTNRMFVCGDLHGSIDIKKLNARNFPQQKELYKNDILIQLGDFGGIWCPLGVNKEQEYWLDWIASKRFTTYVVLGNHENYDVLEQLELRYVDQVKGYCRVLERDAGEIYFFERGGVYFFQKDPNQNKFITFLSIGGATSVDKSSRREFISWWKQENITNKEINNYYKNIEILPYSLSSQKKYVDYIFSHTCPTSTIDKMFGVEYREDYTSNFLDIVMREDMDFREWHFGHFHQDKHFQNFYCHYNNPPFEIT